MAAAMIARRAQVLFVGIAILLVHTAAAAQSLTYTKGQNISPAYEGWEQTPDGVRYFLFGYMNRNWEEEIDVPVGPDNGFNIGGADQGQPTHFLPRRNRFVFRVRVPNGFTDKDELIWTLTAHGKTEKAYVKVGEPLTLVSEVKDNGIPKPRAPDFAGAAAGGTPRLDAAATAATATTPSENTQRPNRATMPPSRVTVGKNVGLHVSWFMYRGPAGGKVAFDPPQIKAWEDTRAGANSPWAPVWVAPPMPEDGKSPVHATFSEPGTYVLRCLTDDGALTGGEDVTIVVVR